jgi:hypothetical protein
MIASERCCLGWGPIRARRNHRATRWRGAARRTASDRSRSDGVRFAVLRDETSVQSRPRASSIAGPDRRACRAASCVARPTWGRSRAQTVGLMPLDQAFDQLMSAVGELETVRNRASDWQALARPSWWSERRSTIASWSRGNSSPRHGATLVGPESGHHDALVRASLARQVVGAYVTTILAGPGGRISRRAAVLGRCLGWPRSGMGYLCGPLSAALLRPEGGRVAGYDVMSRAGFE